MILYGIRSQQLYVVPHDVAMANQYGHRKGNAFTVWLGGRPYPGNETGLIPDARPYLEAYDLLP